MRTRGSFATRARTPKARVAIHPLNVHFADAYEVRDGKIVRAILGYADVAKAIGDVGAVTQA